MKYKVESTQPVKDLGFFARFHSFVTGAKVLQAIAHLISAITGGSMAYLLGQQFFAQNPPPAVVASAVPYIVGIFAVIVAIGIEYTLRRQLPTIVDVFARGEYKRYKAATVLSIIMVLPVIVASFWLTVKGTEMINEKAHQGDKPKSQSIMQIRDAASVELDNARTDYETEVARLEGLHESALLNITNKYTAQKTEALSKAAHYDELSRKGHAWAAGSAKVQRSNVNTIEVQEADAKAKATETHQQKLDKLAVDYKMQTATLKSERDSISQIVKHELDEQTDSFEAKMQSNASLFMKLGGAAVLIVVVCTLFIAIFERDSGIDKNIVALRDGVLTEYWQAATVAIKRALRLKHIPDPYAADRIQDANWQNVIDVEGKNREFGAEKYKQLSGETRELPPLPNDDQNDTNEPGTPQYFKDAYTDQLGMMNNAKATYYKLDDKHNEQDITKKTNAPLSEIIKRDTHKNKKKMPAVGFEKTDEIPPGMVHKTLKQAMQGKDAYTSNLQRGKNDPQKTQARLNWYTYLYEEMQKRGISEIVTPIFKETDWITKKTK